MSAKTRKELGSLINELRLQKGLSREKLLNRIFNIFDDSPLTECHLYLIEEGSSMISEDIFKQICFGLDLIVAHHIEEVRLQSYIDVLKKKMSGMKKN